MELLDGRLLSSQLVALPAFKAKNPNMFHWSVFLFIFVPRDLALQVLLCPFIPFFLFFCPVKPFELMPQLEFNIRGRWKEN